MTPASPSPSSLHVKVAALETQVTRMARQRRLAALALAAVLPFATVAACGSDTDASADGTSARQDGSFFELEVSRLLLRDRDGDVAAKLETDPERGVMLTLFGAPDVPALELHAGEQFSNIRLYNGGTQRFEVTTDSAASTARLSLLDMEQRPILQASHESGLTSLYLLGDPGDRGLRPNIGFTMQPGANLPYLSTRNQQNESEVWGLGN